MRDAVHHNSAHGDLSLIALAARLGGDEPREQRHVAGGVLLDEPRGRNAERRERFRARLAVGGETVFLLEEQHRRLRAAAVNAVHVGAVVAPVLELLLNFGNDAAGRAALVRRRVRPLRERDDRYIDREQHRDRNAGAFYSIFCHKKPSKPFFIVWRGAICFMMSNFSFSLRGLPRSRAR